MRRQRQMFVVVRPDLIESGPTWWRPGLSVSAEIGTDADEGVLRITPAGPHKLLSSGRHKQVAMLRLQAFSWIKVPTRMRAEVTFEHHDEWLQITLPDWARRVRVTPPRPPISSSTQR
jgi:hypothetical protein